jgi:hypothetical protein
MLVCLVSVNAQGHLAKAAWASPVGKLNVLLTLQTTVPWPVCFLFRLSRPNRFWEHPLEGCVVASAKSSETLGAQGSQSKRSKTYVPQTTASIVSIVLFDDLNVCYPQALQSTKYITCRSIRAGSSAQLIDNYSSSDASARDVLGALQCLRVADIEVTKKDDLHNGGNCLWNICFTTLAVASLCTQSFTTFSTCHNTSFKGVFPEPTRSTQMKQKTNRSRDCGLQCRKDIQFANRWRSGCFGWLDALEHSKWHAGVWQNIRKTCVCYLLLGSGQRVSIKYLIVSIRS